MTLNIFLATVFSFFYSLFTLLQQRYLKTNISPIELNFFTYLGAAIILATYFFLFKPSIIKPVSRKGLTFAALVGLFASVIGDSLIYLGFTYSSVINWGILSLLIALFTFILSVKFLGEKSTKNRIFALVLSLIGAFVAIYRPGEQIILNFGDLFFMAGVIIYAVANILNKKALGFLSVFQLTFYRILTAAIILGIVVLYMTPAIKNLPWIFIFLNSVWIIVAVSLVNVIMKRAGPTFFSLSVNLVPIFTFIMATLLFREAATIYQFIGGIMVIGSIIIFSKQNKNIRKQ